LPSTSTSASPETDAGAALRASAISSAGFAIVYCASGAMAGYEAVSAPAETIAQSRKFSEIPVTGPIGLMAAPE
jgi:hypothetical protein